MIEQSKNLGFRHRPSPDGPLKLAVNRIAASVRTDVYYLRDATGNGDFDYCAVGAVCGRNPEHAGGTRFTPAEQDALQALFFAIPREARDQLVRTIVKDQSLSWRPKLNVIQRRLGAVARYNDSLDKVGVYGWVKFALSKVELQHG